MKANSPKIYGHRSAIATALVAAVVVVIIAIIAVGAYVALGNTGANTVTVTQGGSTVTVVSSQIITSVFTSGGSTITSVVTTASTATSVVTTASTATTTLSSSAAASVTLNGAGATFPYPLISSWTYNYTAAVANNVFINYASVGSGAGIAQITAKTVDFGASDAPLTPAQTAAAPGLLHIPETIGTVTMSYNLPGIPTGLKFNGTVIANIYLGKITMWNDPALVQLNPGVSLPAQSIFVVHRSDGSGTTFVFTDYLSQVSTDWKSQVGKGTSVNWPNTNGIGAKGNEGVGGVVLGNKYALGYLEYAYALVNKATYGVVQNAAGNFVLPNSTTAAAAVRAAAVILPAGNGNWSSVSVIDSISHNTTATLAYPITSFTYLLVYQKQTDAVKGAALANFLWWVINKAQNQGVSLGYIPLPSSVVALDDQTILSMTYNGSPVITTSTT